MHHSYTMKSITVADVVIVFSKVYGTIKIPSFSQSTLRFSEQNIRIKYCLILLNTNIATAEFYYTF